MMNVYCEGYGMEYRELKGEKATSQKHEDLLE
jgi:hypothetical protein